MKNKKGFTIIELVIVIAVIAVLAAVLIPSFVRLVRKSKVSNDTSFVKELNNALAADKAEGNAHNTMTDALNATLSFGLDVVKINAKASNNEFLWDSKNDVFCYLNDGNIEYYPNSVEGAAALSAGDPYLWKIYKGSVPALDDQTYSIYVADADAASSVSVVKVGIDCGEQTIDNITYENSGAKKDVVIRTNGGTLTINAENDTVRHYGSANVVDVKKVAETSYYENGVATFIKVAQGRIVVEEGSDVAIGGIHVSNNNVIVAVENNAVLPAVTFEDGVSTFKVQTTDNDGKKTTESVVTVSGDEVTTAAESGEKAVPENVKVKIEVAEKKTEADAENSAVEIVAPLVSEDTVVRIGARCFDTFEEAFAASKSGDTVVVLANYVLAATQNVDKDLTLDLNGKTIEFALSQKVAFDVVTGGSLVLKDSGENGKIALRNGYGIGATGGDVTVNSGSISTLLGDTVGVVVYNGNKVTVNGGAIDVKKHAIYSLKNSGGGIIDVKGGHLSGSVTINLLDACTLNVSGGEIASTGNNCINLSNEASTVNVTGGKLSTKTAGGSYGVITNDTHNTIVNISGGVLESAGNVVWSSGSNSAGITVNVSGDAALRSTSTSTSYYVLNIGKAATADYPVSIQISGGTISGKKAVNILKSETVISGGTISGAFDVKQNADVTITGGTFDNNTITFTSGTDGANTGIVKVNDEEYKVETGKTRTITITGSNGSYTIE